MLEQTHTSLDLSKWLYSKGFFKKTKYRWGKSELKELNFYFKAIPCYDILNDLCVKHAKELFEKEYLLNHKQTKISISERTHCEQVLFYMQQGKKEEAEKYIMENCIL